MEKMAGFSILRKVKQIGEKENLVVEHLPIDEADIEFAVRLYQKLKSPHVSVLFFFF